MSCSIYLYIFANIYGFVYYNDPSDPPLKQLNIRFFAGIFHKRSFIVTNAEENRCCNKNGPFE